MIKKKSHNPPTNNTKNPDDKLRKKLPAFVLLLRRSLSGRRKVEKPGFIQLLVGRRKARSPQKVPARGGELGGEWVADTGRGAIQGLGGDLSAAPPGAVRSSRHFESCSDELLWAPALR